MNLVLDFGNTCIKVACFEEQKMIDFFSCENLFLIEKVDFIGLKFIVNLNLQIL